MLRILLMAVLFFAFSGFSSEKGLNPLFWGVKSLGEKSINFKPYDNYQIAISKEAFGKLFLLKTAHIDGPPTPTGKALANKIVFFEKNGEYLFMFESTNGKLASASIPTKILLAKFKIKEEKSDHIVFNFEEGMKLAFIKSSIYVSDFPNSDQETVVEVATSYIGKVFVRDEYFYIDQVVHLKDPSPKPGAEAFLLTQIKFTFSEYKPNKDFKKKASPGLSRVGFFEGGPILNPESGEKEIHIVRFDHQKPIVFHLSSNVPSEHRQAVIDGVEYWNKVFKKDVLKVKDLPEGIEVHEPGYNIIRWLKWDSAGIAYANTHADPLNGEILGAHVYLTSAFPKGGLQTIKKIFADLSNKKSFNELKYLDLKIPGFSSATTCNFSHKNLPQEISRIISHIEIEGIDKSLTEIETTEIYERFVNDYIRMTVAHEVGHTLGLRHNFAGSLVTTLNAKNFQDILKKYLFEDELPEVFIPTSTVMDYTPTDLAALQGALIRKRSSVLPYDQNAILFAYENKKPETFGPFCTDGKGQGSKYYGDCLPFDMLPHPIEYNLYKIDNIVGDLATRISFMYEAILGISNSPEVLKNILKNVPMGIRADTKRYVSTLRHFAMNLRTDSEFVSLQKPIIDHLGDENKWRQIVVNFQKKGLGERKLADLFLKPLIPEDFSQNSYLRLPLSKEIQRAVMARLYGRGLLTEDIKGIIQENLTSTLVKFEKELLLYLPEAFKKMSFSIKEKEFLTQLQTLIRRVLFNKDLQVYKTLSNGYEFKYPEFEYRLDQTRDLRGNMLELANVDLYSWSPSYKLAMERFKKKIFRKHQNQIETMLDTLNDWDLEDDVYDWVYFEKERFKKIKEKKEEV